MCLIDISVEVIRINMSSYVEESCQSETYLIRKDPVAITGNSTHLAGGSASPSRSNTLMHTHKSHKALFNYRKYHICFIALITFDFIVKEKE